MDPLVKETKRVYSISKQITKILEGIFLLLFGATELLNTLLGGWTSSLVLGALSIIAGFVLLVAGIVWNKEW